MRTGSVEFRTVRYGSSNTPSGSETERADSMISRGRGVKAGVHGSIGSNSST